MKLICKNLTDSDIDHICNTTNIWMNVVDHTSIEMKSNLLRK
jgi:hypothetical protein